MKNLYFLLFLLFSCAESNLKKSKVIDDIDIDKDLTFNEFKKQITEYVNQSNYPDIN